MANFNKKELTIGIMIILLAAGISYIIPEELKEDYKFYDCDDLGKGMLCWKLSKVNEETGLRTWCYWNISAPKRYKKCSSGWYLHLGEIIGEEIPEKPKDFLNFSNYTITEVKCNNLSCDPVCIEIHEVKKSCFTPKPNSNFTETIKVFEEDYLARVELRKRLNQRDPTPRLLILEKQVKEYERRKTKA